MTRLYLEPPTLLGKDTLYKRRRYSVYSLRLPRFHSLECTGRNSIVVEHTPYPDKDLGASLRTVLRDNVFTINPHVTVSGYYYLSM